MDSKCFAFNHKLAWILKFLSRLSNSENWTPAREIFKLRDGQKNSPRPFCFFDSSILSSFCKPESIRFSEKS